MQFNFYLNQSHNVATFTNFNISKVAAKEKLFELFRRIGGDNPQYELEWIFPKTVYRYHIEEIIHNTCFVCGGLMKDGQALDNTYVSFDDFGNDAGQRGTTQSKMGHPIMKQVRKCSSCGHSHT